MDENEKSWLDYLAEMGDVGWGVPGAGEGLESLVNYFGLPELYKSYGDTNWDRLTNYNMYLDPIKMGGNVVSDIVSFAPDVVGDLPAAAIDRFANADYYNPFAKENLERNTIIPGIDFQDSLTQYGKYALDASPYNPMPSFYTEEQGGNPLDPKVGERVYRDAEKLVADHYAKETAYLDKDNDGYIDSIQDDLTENIPPYWKWAYDNPQKDPEDYEELVNDEYEKGLEKIFPLKEEQKLYDKTVNELFQGRYGIDDPYKYFNQPMAGPGLRQIDLEGINLPFTDKYDVPFQYGSFGDPIFKYSTPEAKDTYTKMNIIGEILAGVPSALKWIGKKTLRKGAKEGVKDSRKEYEYEPTWRKR
tara:strand:+ start:44 stop:1123 length:1080 start_codon:yes stop_codon:yes gene_type:complete